MKTKTLFLLGVLTLSISCERLPTGPSDCYFYVYNRIDEIEKDYNYEMTHVVDSEGYSNSLEACIMQRDLTYSYIAEYEDIRDVELGQNQGCSEAEKSELNGIIEKKIQGLNNGIENVWSHCEELHGGG